MIKKTAEWEVAFGNLEGMTNTSLQVILKRLLEFKEKSKGTLSLSDAAELQRAIDNVQAAANRNPFQNITASLKNYRTSIKDSKKAQEEYNKVLKENADDAEKVAAAGAKMVEADKKAADAKQKLISQLQKGQDIFNAIGNGERIGRRFRRFRRCHERCHRQHHGNRQRCIRLGKIYCEWKYCGNDFRWYKTHCFDW